jgi:drug/metabolite transporter (DMT)-like permease
MILTDAVTIRQLSPIFMIFLSSLFLREEIGVKKITIFVLAFLGTLLVIKPGFLLDLYPAVIALLGSISADGSHVAIAIRSLRLTDHPLVIINYSGYSIGLISFGTLLWQGNFIIPDALSFFFWF